MRTRIDVFRLLLLTFGIAFSLYSQADIVISGTRVIYPQDKSAVTVHLDNRGDKPLLVQTWLDNGLENAAPEEIQSPFVITPPITRIDKEHGQTVRVIYTGEKLPADRESLYWFNVLEVPPKDSVSESLNKLQLAFRTRIKFIYRPRSLDGDLGEAMKKVEWVLGDDNGRYYFSVHNNSGYYLSMDKACINIAGKRYSVDTKMLNPFSSEKLSINKLSGENHSLHGKVEYSVINDFGGDTEAETAF